MRWWVGFCVGLVRLAEERERVMGNCLEEWRDGEGYKWKEWGEGICVEDLLEEMGMERRGGEGEGGGSGD